MACLSLYFSIATSRFSEAIIDFLADEQRATEARIRAEDFEGEAYSIYELFTTIWLQSKESKVRPLQDVHQHLSSGFRIAIGQEVFLVVLAKIMLGQNNMGNAGPINVSSLAVDALVHC